MSWSSFGSLAAVLGPAVSYLFASEYENQP